MKSMAMLAAATAAALVVNASGALSQEVCSKAYGVCMNACVEKAAKDVQDACMNSCQAKNNQCSAEVFGGRQERGPAAQSPVDGKKAKEVTSPPPRKVDVAPRPADAGKDASRAEGSMRKVDVPPRKKAGAAAEAKTKTESAPSPVRELPAEAPK
jgi:hypothetical protein